MKLVFFDLKRNTPPNDDSVYSKPLASSPSQVAQARSAVQSANFYYNNKIMNFYGDSFHVTRPGYGMNGYGWNYAPANSNRMVVNTPRKNSELGKTYQPLQVNLPMGAFVTPSSCQPGIDFVTPSPTSKPWPTTCKDIDDTAIRGAINGGTVGFMLLNGKRLGNLNAIEAIPNAAIQGFYDNQKKVSVLGAAAGEIQYNAGTRGGVDGDKKLVCTTKSLTNCYIGRFGWLGDRVSLEDQVANAAFVEMNMTTKAGYKQLYPNGSDVPIRYNVPNCGPADKKCKDSGGNRDLTELDIDRMADYARWLGNPTRSEFTVFLPDVIAGEKIFVDKKCNTCHVIEKIEIPDPNDTMLTLVFRDRLAKRVDPTVDKSAGNPCMGKACPFLSYLGTDLLMHDMGYLSQVGNASGSIRGNDGVVKAGFKDYVQKIRTPALKGLRFNRFVTDSHKNTKNTCFSSTSPTTPAPCPACDFLLHDGRACDAIEAAFLHDGPAIAKLGVIPALTNLKPDAIRQLRAFLYSL
jgi:Di-haem oxidoreductase, putative peroxidase